MMILISATWLFARVLLANEAHEQLLSSPEDVRRAAFQLIVTGAGETCNAVTRIYFQGEAAGGHAVWNIDCGGDNAYSIDIAPNAGGSTRLIPCRLIQHVEGRECFKPFAGRQ